MVAYKAGDLAAALSSAETARATALSFDSALLAAECSALLALTLKRLGRTAAEERRAEAEAGFRMLGAERLVERLAEDWGAIPARRRP